jgi:hypothetical protein
MTTITETSARTSTLQVRTDPAGKPLAIRHDGQIWLVDPYTDVTHWFGTDARRDTPGTAAVGSGGRSGTEYWRVQVRTGSASAPRIFTLCREPLSPGWMLAQNSDGE